MNDAPVPRAQKNRTIKNFGNFSLGGVETLNMEQSSYISGEIKLTAIIS